jgi:hypothetical protein
MEKPTERKTAEENNGAMLFLRSDKASDFRLGLNQYEWSCVHTWMKEYAKQEAEIKAQEFKEELKQFLYDEITERRDYSASKMCEIIIEKLK